MTRYEKQENTCLCWLCKRQCGLLCKKTPKELKYPFLGKERVVCSLSSINKCVGVGGCSHFDKI